VIEAVGAKSSLAWFSSADKHLGALDANALGAMVCAASDVALILDSHGVVLDFAISDPVLAKAMSPDWIGRRWTDTVTTESRPKIEEMLREATSTTPTRWRQVNYTAPNGPDTPMRYCALRFGPERRVLAVGRDLRALASAQQRLAEAQQAMEREYQRIRDAEKRYRLLFQLANEAVLIVDAGNHRVLEGNPAASALLGFEPKKIAGQSFSELFTGATRQAAQSFVAAARVAPRVDNVMVEAAADGTPVLLSGALFRQESATYVIVLISRMGRTTLSNGVDLKRLKIIEAMPEAFAVANADLRIVSANAAFVDLVQATTEAQVRGEPLERWLGRPGIDAALLLTNLRGAGVVRRFATFVRGEFGSNEDVEISAVSELEGPDPCIGLTLSVVATRGGRERLGGRELPKTVEQFTDLVGRVPLKNLVRETTDLIERLCIEAALELTKDNRASAAEMLGLSRQGFYAKLRRYGLGDLEGESSD
jgi:transcriptional regulator PpsR